MKTKEFKHIISENDFDIDENVQDLNVIKNKSWLATINKNKKSNFSIMLPDMLNDESINAIIEYAQTSIDDREYKPTFFNKREVEFARDLRGEMPSLKEVLEKTSTSSYGIELDFTDLSKYSDFKEIIEKVSYSEVTEDEN